MLSSGESKCPGKAIYSELNYEKLRQNRMKELDAYYTKVLKQYETKKQIYNKQFEETAKQANNADSELENKTNNEASNDERQEADAVIRPTIIKLNKQLIKIASNVVKDNEDTGKGLMQQYQDLKVQEEELNKLMNNVVKLEEKMDAEKNVELTRDARIETSGETTDNTYYWHNGILVINFLLSFFLVIYAIMIYYNNNSV